jgi:hypothetical protein
LQLYYLKAYYTLYDTKSQQQPLKEWSCFVYYAHKVRELHWDGYQGKMVHFIRNLYSLLYREDPLLSISSILPNLKILDWVESREYYFPVFHLFSGKALKELTILADRDLNFARRFEYWNGLCLLVDRVCFGNISLESLIVILPELVFEPLVVDHAFLLLADRMRTWPQDILLSSPHLRKYFVRLGTPFPGSPITKPWALDNQNLTSLGLELSKPLVSDSLTFPALQDLAISFRNPDEELVDFMRTLSCPRLSTLHLIFGSCGAFEETSGENASRSVLTLPTWIYEHGVCQANYHKTVTTFSLEFVSAHVKDQTAALEVERAFYDALIAHPFPNLKCLILDTTKFHAFADNIVETLPKAYPRIQRLHLTTIRTQELEYIPTLPIKRIHDLVSRLPHLHTLWMPFKPGNQEAESQPIDSPEVFAELSAKPAESLRVWNVIDSGLGLMGGHYLWSPELRISAAKCLRAAFPRLERVEFVQGRDLAPRQWNQVNDYLRDHPYGRQEKHRSLLRALKQVFDD